MNLKLRLSIDYYVGGATHVVVKPIVVLLGKILRRNHSLAGIDKITVIKLLGGGSLVMAYPSLLALKIQNPKLKIDLVTTPPIKPFADLLGLFDEIIVIRDDSAIHLAVDSTKAIIHLWRSKALIDLEIHSRLSSIFTLITCALNRIGFYTDVSYWRRALYTHLLFYNKYAPIYLLYDQIAVLLGAQPVAFSVAQDDFRSKLAPPDNPLPRAGKVLLAVAPGCSDLGRERSLTPQQWCEVLQKRCDLQDNLVFYFLGVRKDHAVVEQIIAELKVRRPKVECHNYCGGYSLQESVKIIGQVDALYCIDSSLVHLARLLGIKTISYWGPTDPAMRLRPDPRMQEEVHYVRLSCSPCVHIVDEAPCYGNNICMQAAVQSDKYTGERNPHWLAKD